VLATLLFIFCAVAIGYTTPKMVGT